VDRLRRAAVKAVCTQVPKNELTNEQLAKEYDDWNAEKIFQKTGIAVRHIAASDECASDLGVGAAQKLFESGRCEKQDVDFLLLCTQSPDYFLPTTACIMQHRLGLRTSCGALDFNQGCSGYVYGLALAKGLIESGSARHVLLITAETYSKFIHPQDRSVRTLFGDGASATLIGGLDSDEELIGPIEFGTDGSGAEQLIVPAGGMRMPRSAQTAVEQTDTGGNVRCAQNLYMNGAEIFNFTIRTVPEAVKRLLMKAGMLMDEVDYFVFHQANRFMLDHLRKKLAIPEEKFCINMQGYGNTVSSTIPMALEIAHQRKEIRLGSRVMLVGFGVGFSWAAAMIKVVE